MAGSGVAMDNNKRMSGFTLIELLVVVAIIALLVSILVPSLNKARAVTLQAVCASNLHQLHVGTMTAATANDGKILPYGRDDWYYDEGQIMKWASASDKPVVLDYFGQTPELWYCPANPIKPNTSWPWPGLGLPEAYPRAWGFKTIVADTPYFYNVTYMRLFHLMRLPESDFDYDTETVTSINSSSTLGLWADCNIWMPNYNRWMLGNHPGIKPNTNRIVIKRFIPCLLIKENLRLAAPFTPGYTPEQHNRKFLSLPRKTYNPSFAISVSFLLAQA